MNAKTHFLAMFLIVLNIAAHATGIEKDSKRSSVRVIKQAGTYKLIYTKKTHAKVGVQIFDESGKLLFSEQIRNKEGFIRPYNFSELDYGLYTMVITDAKEKVTQKVTHGEKRGSDNKAFLQLIKMKELPEKNGVYHLTIVNQGKAEANINVKNDDNEVVFSSTEELNGNYGKLFNLKDLKRGGSFEISLRNETVTFDF